MLKTPFVYAEDKSESSLGTFSSKMGITWKLNASAVVSVSSCLENSSKVVSASNARIKIMNSHVVKVSLINIREGENSAVIISLVYTRMLLEIPLIKTHYI